MQNLDVITINLWHILISLCNLLILFLILKKFLYKPVRRVAEEREETLRRKYFEADEAVRTAEEKRLLIEKQMQVSENKANELLTRTSEQAKRASDEIISQAKANSDIIISRAKNEAEAEYKKMQEKIKKEIADVSVVWTEKLLRRELKSDDRHAIVDGIISEIGEEDV